MVETRSGVNFHSTINVARRVSCLRYVNSTIRDYVNSVRRCRQCSRDEFEFGRTSFGRRTTRRPRERRYASGDFEIPVRALTPRSATSRSKYRAASAVANVVVVGVVVVVVIVHRSAPPRNSNPWRLYAATRDFFSGRTRERFRKEGHAA
jgi:hypothetical protein